MMGRRFCVRIGLAVGVVFAGIGLLSSAASAVLIDFETLPGGGPPPNFGPVGDSYSSEGVVFGTLEGASDLRVPAFNNRSAHIGGSDYWIRDAGRDLNGSVGFHILATFASPVDFVAADTLGSSRADLTIIASAFDATGFLLGSVESDGSFGALKGRLTLDGLGPISSVVWQTSQPFVGSVQIDNLEFNIVPEPTSALLMGLGLTMLGSLRSARRARGRS